MAREFKRILEAENLERDVSDEALYALQYVQEFFDGLGFCLSGDGDILSQWRGYADDGQGFSIGFSKEYLIALSKAQEEEGPTFSLKEVKYGQHEHEAVLRPIYDQIRLLVDSGKIQPNSLSEYINFDNRASDPISRHNPAYSLVWGKVFSIIGSIYTLKSNAFAEEKEWRLVSHLQRNGDSDAKYRAFGNRLVPYLEFELIDLGIKPIERVYVGPKNITPDFVISRILKQYGFLEVDVVRSSATYR